MVVLKLRHPGLPKKSTVDSSENESPSASTPTNHANPVRWSDIAARRKSTHPDAASVNSVLDIYELCERILDMLPLTDLLMAQRICKRTNAVVKSSSVHQSRLFLRADANSGQRQWRLDNKGCLLIGEGQQEYRTSVRFVVGGSRRVTPHVYNPLLLYKDEKVHPENVLSPTDMRFPETVWQSLLPWKRLIRAIPIYASCRDMLLSQPPVTKVRVEIHGRREFMPWEDRRGLPKWFDGCICTLSIENASGVTFGQVIDAVKPKLSAQDARVANLTFVDGLAVSGELKELVEDAEEKRA